MCTSVRANNLFLRTKLTSFESLGGMFQKFRRKGTCRVKKKQVPKQHAERRVNDQIADLYLLRKGHSLAAAKLGSAKGNYARPM